MIPHEFVFPSISVTGGTTVGTPLTLMRRGTIKKLRVVQLSGTLAGFSYCLYNTKAACGTDGSTDLGVDERLYRITPLLVVASSADSYVSAETYPEDGISNLDLAYECMDDNDGGHLLARATNVGRSLMLKIIAAGTGAKTFGVAMTIMDPMI